MDTSSAPNYGSTAGRGPQPRLGSTGGDMPSDYHAERTTTTTAGGYKASYSAGYNATGTTGASMTGTYFDSAYLGSRDGILKIVEMSCTLIAFIIAICTWSSGYVTLTNRFGQTSTVVFNEYAHGTAIYTECVTMIAFLITLVLLFMYMYHVVEKYGNFPWNLTEGLYCLAVGFCLLIAGAVMIPSFQDSARGAVVFFAWAAMIAYFVDAGYKLQNYRRNIPAQGGNL